MEREQSTVVRGGSVNPLMNVMKRSLAISLGLALTWAAPWVSALDDPHNFTCVTCHEGHTQPSGDLMSATGNANLCMSCHSPGGQASELPFSHLDRGDPDGTQSGSSHAWQVAPDNTAAGAEVPGSPTLFNAMRDGQIVCSTCHDQHWQSVAEPFLRVANDNDALCLDCHRSRNLGRWTDNPGVNIGSHPVTLAIPSNADYRQPGDGESYLPLSSGTVVCTTCHAVHYAPSTTTIRHTATGGGVDALSVTVTGAGWTPDAHVGWEAVFPGAGFNQRERRVVAGNTADTLTWFGPLPAAVQSGELLVLQESGPGDGTLLRAPNDDALCKRCHNYPDHPSSNPVHSCRACHTPHSTDNILLVREEVNGAPVTLQGVNGTDLVHGAPNYDGICEVCHTQTVHHQNSARGDHAHGASGQCTDCHLHENAFQAECGGCHDFTTETLTTGSHAAHFTSASGPMINDCAVCHGPRASEGTHSGHLNGVVNFGGAAMQTLDQTSVCTVCHSPTGAFDGLDDATLGAKPNWADGVYAAPGVLRAGLELWCATCHDDDPNTPGDESSLIQGVYAPGKTGDNTTYGYYVTGHGRAAVNYPPESWQASTATGNPAANQVCTACHDATSAHIDGAAGSDDRLKPGFMPDQDNGACAQCHDPGNLANGAPHYYVDSATYETSRHSFFLCSSCHDLHGMVADGGRAMTPRLEENLCATCHATVVSEFLETSHHDIDDAEQAVNGSRIECTMCHNPHIASASQPTADPDDLTVAWADATSRDFCLRCHDGDPPAAVTFPAVAPGSGWDQTGYGDHPQTGSSQTCRSCHTPHGSSNLLLVEEEILGTAVTFTDRGVGGHIQGAPNYNGVCESCHTATDYHRGNSTGDHDHNTATACVSCHPHGEEFEGSCSSCHEGTTDTLISGSHPTHFTAAIGPGIADCATCHGTDADTGGHAGHLNGVVNFVESATASLEATAACDTCHSPLGLADGVTEAKNAWATGVYQAPGSLAPNHLRWCLGCHDDDPTTTGVNESAQFGGSHAPPIGGDGATYGFYVTGHGREGANYPSMSWQAEGAQGNPAASMSCNWCHDATSGHVDGTIGTTTRLLPTHVPDQSNSGCSECHRPLGAGASLPNYFTTSEEYETSEHRHFLCTSCHDPHGRSGPHPAMMGGDEENFCGTCHPGQLYFSSLSSHHDIDDTEQVANGSRIECTMCHNPHTATRAAPLADPDDLTAHWTATSSRDFCLACHDGAPPANVTFPATSVGTGWDQSAFINTRHDVALGGQCDECHEPHGTDYPSLLPGGHSLAETTAASEAAYGACFACHDYTDTVADQNAFSDEHSRHVVDESIPCIACHNAHAPHDAGEDGHIDFEFATTHGFDIALTAGGTPYDLSSSFLDLGPDQGRCHLTCHGEDHNPENYAGVPVSTVDCLLCHVTNPRPAE